jgi:hypothetical protein
MDRYSVLGEYDGNATDVRTYAEIRPNQRLANLRTFLSVDCWLWEAGEFNGTRWGAGYPCSVCNTWMEKQTLEVVATQPTPHITRTAVISLSHSVCASFSTTRCKRNMRILSIYFAPVSRRLQGVMMKGIRNKTIISQKAFIIRIYGLHHYKRKLSKLFSEYITFQWISMWALLVALQICRRYSTSFHDAWSMLAVTVATAPLMRAFRCWRSLIFTW